MDENEFGIMQVRNNHHTYMSDFEKDMLEFQKDMADLHHEIARVTRDAKVKTRNTVKMNGITITNNGGNISITGCDGHVAGKLINALSPSYEVNSDNGNIVIQKKVNKPTVERLVTSVEETADKEPIADTNVVDDEHYNKQRVKNEQKKTGKKKFKWVIGNHYILKRKPRDGGKPLIWEYELIKYVYSIGTCPMNSLIVKKISGPDELIYSISPNDCKRLHIKYQPGLEIMSMNTEGLMPKKIRK